MMAFYRPCFYLYPIERTQASVRTISPNSFFKLGYYALVVLEAGFTDGADTLVVAILFYLLVL